MSPHSLGRAAATSLVLVGLLGVAPPALGHPGRAARTHRSHRSHRSPSGPAVAVTLTTENLHRALSPMAALRFSPRAASAPTLHVDDGVRYQPISGFGGAMTDSSAWLLDYKLAPPLRAQIMNLLFNRRTGIGLNVVRVPMGASDFSATEIPYTYDDVPAGQSDPQLAHFSIQHDRAYILPALRQMLSVDPRVRVLATEWSPPGWMKANDALDNEHESGLLEPSSYGALAQYFVKFLQSYRAAGVPVAAITPQNEPLATTTYPGLNLSAAGEAQLIAEDLVPALRQAGLHPQLFGGDVGNQLFYGEDLESSTAAPSLAGMAWHCYGGMGVMSQFHALYPSVPEIMSECSPGIVPYAPAEIGITALRNWATSVGLWNLALDPAGGPVQPPNPSCQNCVGLVRVNESTHTATLTRSYFQLGQLSRFISPGAVRVRTERWVSDFSGSPGARYGTTPGLDNVAVVNPDGQHVLVAYNSGSQTSSFAVSWHRQQFSYRLAPRATVTFSWR